LLYLLFFIRLILNPLNLKYLISFSALPGGEQGPGELLDHRSSGLSRHDRNQKDGNRLVSSNYLVRTLKVIFRTHFQIFFSAAYIF
jgi:hypothetical protein